jgi:hypothetical protein
MIDIADPEAVAARHEMVRATHPILISRNASPKPQLIPAAQALAMWLEMEEEALTRLAHIRTEIAILRDLA